MQQALLDSTNGSFVPPIGRNLCFRCQCCQPFQSCIHGPSNDGRCADPPLCPASPDRCPRLNFALVAIRNDDHHDTGALRCDRPQPSSGPNSMLTVVGTPNKHQGRDGPFLFGIAVFARAGVHFTYCAYSVAPTGEIGIYVIQTTISTGEPTMQLLGKVVAGHNRTDAQAAYMTLDRERGRLFVAYSCASEWPCTTCSRSARSVQAARSRTSLFLRSDGAPGLLDTRLVAGPHWSPGQPAARHRGCYGARRRHCCC